MRRELRATGFLLALIAMAVGATPAGAQWLDLDVPTRPDVEPQDRQARVENGRRVYEARCWFCHGEDGDGRGEIAEYLWPRPRDFTVASYKLRTTHSGELPTDEDLYRTLSLGIPGTAMPEWQSALTPDERWDVIAYLKTFAADLFEDEAFDPYQFIVEIGEPPSVPRDSLIAAGRRVFDEADCWECHGEVGRGDGERAAELEDDWAFPVPPADLHLGWRLKGGSSAREVYVRLTTGLDGTPMPSYSETTTDEERWQLAHYVADLAAEGAGEASVEVVISARRLTGDLPATPEDVAWASVPEIRIPLTGQATFAPRWQVPGVTDMTVRAVYNDDEVALRLEWDDRFADTLPADSEVAAREGWSADDTYPVLYPDGVRVRGHFPDAVEIMFPARHGGGPELPHLVYGSAGQPVELIRWQADTADGSALELRATGPGQAPAPRASQDSGASALGVWRAGRWSVVLRRPLATPDGSEAPELRPGESIPIAFHAWEGANGETGLRMGLSSWYYLYLSESMKGRDYLAIVLAVVAVAALQWGAARAIRARAARGLLGAYGITGDAGDIG